MASKSLTMAQDIIDQLADQQTMESELECGEYLDDSDQSEIFGLIDTFENERNILLFPFLKALLRGSRTSSTVASNRMGIVFSKCIQLLKKGIIVDHERPQLVEILFSCIRVLSIEHAQTCADKVLADFRPSAGTLSGHCGALELLPQLVIQAGSKCRDYIVDKICEMTWPVSATVMLAACLVELSDSEKDCRQAATKISAHIHWRWDLDTQGGTASSARETHLVDPEDLPGLMYQLTALSTKCGEGGLSLPSAISAVKCLVVDEVADALDRLLDSSRLGVGRASNKDEEDAEVGDWLTGGLMSGRSHPPLTRPSAAVSARITALVSTIIHHLALLVSKDQGISSEIVRRIKSRSLLCYYHYRSQMQPSAISVAPPRQLSCARLLLGLLAARAGRIESVVLGGLAETFAEVHGVLGDGGDMTCSLWFEPAMWRGAVQVRPVHLREAFVRMLQGPLMVDAVAVPLVQLSFQLMMHKGPHLSHAGGPGVTMSSWSHLSGANITCLGSTISAGVAREMLGEEEGDGKEGWAAASCSSFGAWLVQCIFNNCSHARLEIAKELALRLHLCGIGPSVGSSSSAAFPHNNMAHTGQSDHERLLVRVLDKLASNCAHGLAEVSSALQDVFMALPGLHPVTAGEVVRVLGPLCAYTPTLADRCALALRKASFSKDTRSRQAAVTALASLLRSQLELTSSGGSGSASGSYHSCSSQDESAAASAVRSRGIRGWTRMSQQQQLSQRVSTGLSVEEVLSLCRRFLQHQAPVRAVLYDKLGGLQQDFPFFRPLILRLLRNHLRGLVSESEMWPVGGGGGGEGSEDAALLLSVDRCVDAAGGINEAICDLLLLATAIVRDTFSSSPGNAMESVQCGPLPVEDECDLSQFSQSDSSGGSSAVSRSSTAVLLDAADLCRTLWRLCRGLAEGDLADYHLPPVLSSSNEYRRLVVLVEAIQTAMVCVMKLPSMTTEESASQSYQVRLALLERLALRLEGMSEQLLVFRRKAKDAEKERAKEKKSRERDLPSSSTTTADHSLSSSSQHLPLPRLAGALQGSRAHIVLGADFMWCEGVELELAAVSEALDALNFNAHDEEQEERDFEMAAADGVPTEVIAAKRVEREMETSAMVKLQDAASAAFLQRHLAERALHALEGALCHLEALTPLSASSRHEGEEDGGHIMQCLRGLSNGVRLLFGSLLKDLVRQRTEERDRQGQGATAGGDLHGGWSSLIFPAAGATLFLTPKQVVVRGLLGCVRAQVLAGVLQWGSREEQRMRSLAVMLQEGFERSHIKRGNQGTGSTQLSAWFPQYTASASTMTAAPAPSLEVHTKSFVSLFLAMHGSGDKGGERAEAPLFVALLAEVAGIMPSNMQAKLRSGVLKLCQEKLQNPTVHLSTSLIQLMVLRATSTPVERYEMLSNIADMVENASSSDTDGDADNTPDTTFVLVSSHTAPSASITVTGILDKMAGEIDCLSRLAVKARTVPISSSTSSNPLHSSITSAAGTAAYLAGDTGGRRAALFFSAGGDDEDGEAERGEVAMMDVDSAIYQTLQMCIECLMKLLQIHSSAAVSVAVTSLLLKLYKIQVRLTKEVVGAISRRLLSSVTALSPAFREMSHFTATVATPTVQTYLTHLHNALDHQASALVSSVQGKGSRNKLSKSIPDLIYQMEQLDVCYIKLVASLKDKEKHVVSRWIKRSTARDFRLRADLIELEQDKTRSAVEEKTNRKKEMDQKRSSSSSSGGGTGNKKGTKGGANSGKKGRKRPVGAVNEEGDEVETTGAAAEYYDEYAATGDGGDMEEYYDNGDGNDDVIYGSDDGGHRDAKRGRYNEDENDDGLHNMS